MELKGFVELPEKFVRRLTDGARAFPPEDCGGTFGYEECCEALKIPAKELAKLDGEELDWRKEWFGDWKPERFNQNEVSKRFDQ